MHHPSGDTSPSTIAHTPPLELREKSLQLTHDALPLGLSWYEKSRFDAFAALATFGMQMASMATATPVASAERRVVCRSNVFI